MMRKLRLPVMGVSVALAVMGCASQQSAMKQAPTFVVTTPVVELRPGGKIAMYGTGFAPKQEVMLVLKDAGGGMSSIGSALNPPAVANQDGVWAGEWDYSAYLKTLKAGTGTLTVSDKDWHTLGKAPVVFVAPPPPPQVAAPKGAPAGNPKGATASRR